MTAHNNNKWRVCRAATIAGLCSGLGISCAYAAFDFDPRLSAGVAWVDNVDLVPSSTDSTSQFVEQVIPGMQLQYDGLRAQAFADYQFQALRFDSDHASDTVFQQGRLGLQAAAIEDWLYFDLGADRHQTVLNPTQPINTNNLFQVGNVADSIDGHITPILRHVFSFGELQASYTEGFVHYTQAGNIDTGGADLSDDNSHNQNEYLRFSSNDPFDKVSWQALYRHDKVDYNFAEDFDYEQLNGQLGYLVTPALRLLAQGGLESNPENAVAQGGLNSGSWMGGFDWRDGQRTELRVMGGRRFYGTSYEGLWRYTGRMLDLDISYIEEPTTQNQDQVLRATVAPTTTFPTQINGDFARATADAYLLKRLSGDVGVRGRLTTIYLSLYSEDRLYYTAPFGEDRVRGAHVVVTRRLGPLLTLTGDVAYDSQSLRESDAFRDYSYSLRLSRQLGLHTQVTLTASRTDRTGGLDPYRANWVLLQFDMNFGNPATAGGTAGGFRRQLVTAPTTTPTLPTVPQYQFQQNP